MIAPLHSCLDNRARPNLSKKEGRKERRREEGREGRKKGYPYQSKYYANKLDNLRKINKCLERYKLPKLTQEKLEARHSVGHTLNSALGCSGRRIA